YRIQQTSSGKISLPRGVQELEPIGSHETYNLAAEQKEALSEIIQKLNQHFGTDFIDEDKVCISELEQRLSGSPGLENSVRVNSRENARMAFEHVVNDLLVDMVNSHFKF